MRSVNPRSPGRFILRAGVVVLAAVATCVADNQVISWQSGSTNFITLYRSTTNETYNVVEVSEPWQEFFGLRDDGSVLQGPYWGKTFQARPGLTNVVALTSSTWNGDGFYTLALRSDGTIAGWGRQVAQLPPPSWSNVVSVSGGFNHAIALFSDGTVRGWGLNVNGALNMPAGLTNIVAISAGAYHNLALKGDGRVIGWGANYALQASVPTDLSNVVAIACGFYHSRALTADGNLRAWGNPQSGYDKIPPGLTNVAAIASGSSDLALKTDKTIVNWRPPFFPYPTPRPVPQIATNVISITANRDNMAILGDGPVGSRAFPIHLHVPYGLPLVLPADSGGRRGLGYQWSFEGTDLASSYKGFFSLESADFTNQGTYAVVVSNWYGTITNSYIVKVVPLLILTSPQSQSVYGSASVSFSVTASGVHLAYQWRLNGKDLPGATNGTLLLTNVIPEQAGSYTVLVSNQVGEQVSQAATLGVTPLAINNQPQSQQLYGGQTAAFGVGAIGVAPFQYQWRYNGVDIIGQTNSDLIFTNVVPEQNGVYSVVVRNAYAEIVSWEAVLEVIPLAIISPPRSQSILAGSTVTFDGTAVGIQPITFRWLFEGKELGGETRSELVITNAQFSQAGKYSVIASNRYGSVESSLATLEVSPLRITSPPGSQTTYKNGTVTLQVKADSSVPLTYQWTFNGTNLPDGSTSTLTLTNMAYSQSGLYRVAVSNLYGTVSTDAATVSVVNFAIWGGSGYPPSYEVTTNCIGITAGQAHAVLLKRDGTLVAWGDNTYGQTAVPATASNVISISAREFHNLALRNDGTVAAWGLDQYGLNVIPKGLTNGAAVAAGSFHNLALKTDGSVVAWGDSSAGATTVPANLSNVVAIAAGRSHSLALTADGKVVAWGAHNFPYYGQADVPADLAEVVAIAAGDYHSLALKSDGAVVVWGNAPAGPVGSPGGGELAAGLVRNLFLNADGTLLTWGFGTPAKIAVPPGLGDVVAIAASKSNSLAVIGTGAPLITRQPVNRNMDYGATNWFEITAVGEPPLSLQWKFNGANIEGATNKALQLANLQYAQAGWYSAVVSNRLGMISSTPARLRINRPPVADSSATKVFYVTCNGSNSMVLLNGSRSFDPDGDSLSYNWFDQTSIVPIATGSFAEVLFSIGEHPISLVVNDGLALSSSSLIVSVQTSLEATLRLIAIVRTNAGKPVPLVSTLEAAFHSLVRADTTSAVNQLHTFRNKLAAQESQEDSAWVKLCFETSLQIIDALNCDADEKNRETEPVSLSRAVGGRTQLHFRAMPGLTYVIEASSDLVNWRLIGIASVDIANRISFEDPDSRGQGNRFYRVSRRR